MAFLQYVSIYRACDMRYHIHHMALDINDHNYITFYLSHFLYTIGHDVLYSNSWNRRTTCGNMAFMQCELHGILPHKLWSRNVEKNIKTTLKEPFGKFFQLTTEFKIRKIWIFIFDVYLIPRLKNATNLNLHFAKLKSVWVKYGDFSYFRYSLFPTEPVWSMMHLI